VLNAECSIERKNLIGSVGFVTEFVYDDTCVFVC